MEPPDVTGSSLTLGTAGSRRTVYLLDENASKLAADASNKAAASASASQPSKNAVDNATSASQSSTSPEATAAATAAAAAAAAGNNNNNAGTDVGAAPAAAPASTFLMFNRISNIIGGSVDGGSIGSQHPLSADAGLNGSGTSSERSGTGRDKPKPPTATGAEDGKESAIWYEYGCI